MKNKLFLAPVTLIVAIVYLVINLLIDISYALLDPRVVR